MHGSHIPKPKGVNLMVKTVDSPTTQWSIPRVRIEAKKLVEIVEKCVEHGETVTARAGKYRFEGIDDLKSNAEFLIGSPTIVIGEAEIKLDNSSIRGVSHASYSSSENLTRTEAVAEKLNKYLGEHRTLLRTGWFKYLVSFCASTTMVVLTPPYVVWGWASYAAPFLVFLVSLFLLDLCISTDPVYFRDQANFWSRNKDKLVVGFLMLIFGALIGWGMQAILPNP